MTKNDEMICINDKLLKHGLFLSRLLTSEEYNKIHKALKIGNINNIQEIVINTVMNYGVRGLYLNNFFNSDLGMHTNPFHSLRDIIDASCISFYSRNYIASYFVIIPVIEGMLLRWVSKSKKEIARIYHFKEYINFIEEKRRNTDDSFKKMWITSFIEISEKHLFTNTQKGQPIDDFNRHIVAHVLKDIDFSNKLNIARAFMLIEIILDLYFIEQNITAPYFNANSDKADNEVNYQKKYYEILSKQLSTN